MGNNLLKGKKGIIFGALDEKSIAWKVAERCAEEGAELVLTNAPVALRMGGIKELADKLNCPVIAADATSLEDLTNLITESKKETIISFESYKNEVINFVDKVDEFYKISKPKTLPHDDESEKEGYLRLRSEWKKIRNKYA